MTDTLRRRDFLKASAAFAGAAAASGFTCVEIASAAPIQAPVVDRLAVRVLIDGSFDNFFRPGKVNGVSVEPAPRRQDYRRSLHNQWGLSLFLESQRASEQRNVMLDFGYTPEVCSTTSSRPASIWAARCAGRQPAISMFGGRISQVPRCAAGRRDATRR